MRFSRDWLTDLIELEAADDELARQLTDVGLAVDAVEQEGDDSVFELEITTNRPDCMCHVGIARELAAITGRPLVRPVIALDEASEAAEDVVRVVVEEAELCPRFTAHVVRGVRVGPSPEWLVRRLEAIGSRSINNVVDVTNYVLWETGQPLHAFDLARLGQAEGKTEIRVRRAAAGEELTTLDGSRRELDSEILVIADPDGAVALAGVMGGLDSEVTEATVDVLLEAAHFDPGTVRRGARKLGLHTDASHRFERGCDPEGCVDAARRAVALIVELAGGQPASGVVDIYEPRPEWPPEVGIELARLNRFGGVELHADEVETTLGALGFDLMPDGDSAAWRVRVPSWRWYDFADAYPADVYEEVLRLHGFDHVPSALPAIPGSDRPPSAAYLGRRRIADHLAASGLAEAIHWAFHDTPTDAAFANLFGDSSVPLELANPLSELYGVMRRSLLPQLVASARYNLRRGAESVRLFEIGHVFAAGDGDEPREQEAVGCILGGTLGTPWEGRRELDFFDLKGIVESLGRSFGARLEARPAEVRGLVSGHAAEVVAGQQVIGHIGQLDAESPALFVAELSTAALIAADEELAVVPPSRFPGISVDSTLTHRLTVPWAEIADAVRGEKAEDLVDFGLKDRFTGAGVPAGSVNTTLYFLYNSSERSLTHEEVNERHSRLAAELTRRFSGEHS